MVKIFEWVIISAYNKHLPLHDLQFSYQPNVSTSMCTQVTIETITYFIQNGSDVFSWMMDMGEAFDTKTQHYSESYWIRVCRVMYRGSIFINILSLTS